MLRKYLKLLVCLIFLFTKNYSVFVFGITGSLIFGLIPYLHRDKIKIFFKKVGLHNVWGFFILAFIITALEESKTGLTILASEGPSLFTPVRGFITEPPWTS